MIFHIFMSSVWKPNGTTDNQKKKKKRKRLNFYDMSEFTSFEIKLHHFRWDILPFMRPKCTSIWGKIKPSPGMWIFRVFFGFIYFFLVELWFLNSAIPRTKFCLSKVKFCCLWDKIIRSKERNWAFCRRKYSALLDDILTSSRQNYALSRVKLRPFQGKITLFLGGQSLFFKFGDQSTPVLLVWYD